MNPTFAELLLQEYGVSQPEDIDLEAIAFDQGATIKYRRMDSCEARISGHGTTAVISINNTSHPDRQRFSLAHELGHWVQDKGAGEDLDWYGRCFFRAVECGFLQVSNGCVS